MIATDSRGDLLTATNNAVAPLLTAGSHDRLERDFGSPEGSVAASPRASCDKGVKDKRESYIKMEFQGPGNARRLAVVEEREDLDLTLNLPPKPAPAPFGVSTLQKLRTRKPTLSEARGQPRQGQEQDDEQDEDEAELPPELPPRQPTSDVHGTSTAGRVSSLSNRTASLKSAHVPPNGFFDIEMQCKQSVSNSRRM
jgi:hypothetical protein